MMEFEFIDFWREYPRKVGRLKAEKIWSKFGLFEKADAMKGLERWINSLDWQDIQFIPYPATFLNSRRYEEEPTMPIPKPRDRRTPTAEQNQRDKQAIAEILAKHPELA